MRFFFFQCQGNLRKMFQCNVNVLCYLLIDIKSMKDVDDNYMMLCGGHILQNILRKRNSDNNSSPNKQTSCYSQLINNYKKSFLFPQTITRLPQHCPALHNNVMFNLFVEACNIPARPAPHTYHAGEPDLTARTEQRLPVTLFF